MMRKFTRYLVLLLAFVLILSAAGCKRNDHKIRFGTAGMGGIYYTFGQTYAQLLMSDDESFEIDVKETAGSAANLRLLSEDYIQMAIAQTDLIDDAVHQKKLSGFQAVAGLYTEACQIVVRSDSGIRSARDLQGKRVNLGEEESGTENNARQILQAYGLSEKVITASSLNYTDAVSAMESGEIDAMFVTAGVRTTILETLAQGTDVTFLSLDEESISLLTNTYDFYTETVIPAGTYSGQTGDVRTVGVQSVLLVSDEAGEDTVRQLTAALFDHAADLQHVVPVDLHLTPENAVRGIAIDFHPGALAYYAEAGINPEQEASK